MKFSFRVIRSVRALILVSFFLLCIYSPVLRAGEADELSRIYMILTANPRDVPTLNAYGIELAKIGDLNGAIQTWRTALDIDPDYIHLYNNIGSALRRLGYLKESSDWYKASLAIQPTYWTWYNLGLLYEDLRQPEEAVSAFDAAINIFPNFALAVEHKVRLLQTIEFQTSQSGNRRSISLPGKLQPVDMPSQSLQFEAGTILKNSPSMTISGHGSSVAKNMPSALVETPIREKKETKKKIKPEPKNFGEVESAAVSSGLLKPEAKPAPVVLPSTGAGNPVFFTFDGGADADGIPGILAALGERNIKSTFFLTGHWVENYPDLAIQILAAGHEIANHGMGHHDMASWSKERIAAELEKAEEVFKRVLGRNAMRYFRFPFGAQNKTVERFVTELGYSPVYWDIDTLDWKEPPEDSIISRVRSKLKPGAVILMHCGSKTGSRALPNVLNEVVQRGFRPCTLSSYDSQKIAAISHR